jgi:hypothetical protein
LKCSQTNNYRNLPIQVGINMFDLFLLIFELNEMECHFLMTILKCSRFLFVPKGWKSINFSRFILIGHLWPFIIHSFQLLFFNIFWFTWLICMSSIYNQIGNTISQSKSPKKTCIFENYMKMVIIYPLLGCAILTTQIPKLENYTLNPPKLLEGGL